jgi:predicted transglutaminase-like cysteine proteinase
MGLRRVAAMTLGLVVLFVLAADRKTSLASTAQPAEAAAQASADIRTDIAPATGPTGLPAIEFKPASFMLVSLARPEAPPSPVLPSPAPPAHGNPYGLATSLAPPGALWTKWLNVRADIDGVAPVVDRCRKDFRRCSPATRRFVGIVRQAARSDGAARAGIVNRGINAAIAYTSDKEQWRKDDVWSAPLTAAGTGALQTGKGDCEDYAIAKYVALREAGVATADLQILVVKDTAAKIDHAALAARIDGRWLLLDNRWSRLLEESETAFFTPLFAVSEAGVQRFGSDNEQIATRQPPSPGPIRLAAANAR